MQSFHRALFAVAYASIVSLIAMPASAQPAPGNPPQAAAVQHAPGPIKVSECKPSPGNAPVGFAPAFYPVGVYRYRDVYGYPYTQPNLGNNPTLAIHYMNVGQHVVSKVEFGLVARGTLVAEVRDVGTFSPGAEIKHSFGLNQNVFPLGTGLPICLPLRVTFQDGTQWHSRHLPALQQSLYQR